MFDVEGTLVDCVSETLACWQETFRRFGFEVSRDALQQHSGQDSAEMIQALLPPAAAKRHTEALQKEQGRRYRRVFLPKTKALAGVRPLLESVKKVGWQIGLATSCAEDELAHYLKLTGIKRLVDAVACGEDVEREKPHPDLVEVALERAGRPRAAALVGDTPYDAQAARAAGIQAIGVLTGGFTEAALTRAGCTAVFRDPGHLHKELAALIRRIAAAAPADTNHQNRRSEKHG
jgi:HAD superfamily hydrolase (TIGR01549 family)